MLHTQLIVPFEIDEVYSGFGEAEGILKYDERYLIIEMETKIIGLFKAGIKQYKIPIDEIFSIEYKKKLIGGRITLRPKSILLLKDLPTEKTGELKLDIPRKHRETAENFVRSVNTIILEKRMDELDGL